MKIVSTINYKGGVGKTTLTANLGAQLAKKGKAVLLIDVDPQASLTFSFLTPEYWRANLAKDKTIKNWFTPPRKGPKINFNSLIFEPTRIRKDVKLRGELKLVASNLELINVDLELATRLGGADNKQTSLNFLDIHSLLIDGIQEIEDEFDIIIIDCPPNFNIVTKTAIAASDYVLIPAKPDYLSTMGIDYLSKNLQKLKEEYNRCCEVDDENKYDKINPVIIGVVFTMIQEYGKRPISSQRPFINQTKKLGVPVFKSYVRENKTLFADSAQNIPAVLTNEYKLDVVNEIKNFVSEFDAKIF